MRNNKSLHEKPTFIKKILAILGAIGLIVGIIAGVFDILGIKVFNNLVLIPDYGKQTSSEDDSLLDNNEINYELSQEISNSSDFSRELYTLQEVNENALNEKITFNSIKLADSDAEWYKNKTGKDLPSTMLTNETNFVGAREDTGVNSALTNLWNGNEITAEDGKTYIIRLYVHNNSPYGEEAISENTQVRFYIPYGSSDTITVDGWLKSDNAEPNIYLDDVVFKSIDGQPFHLDYVYGSALLENGNCASGSGIQLTDNITNQGNETGNIDDEWTKIGYYDLDGRIPGCYEYVNYVSIKVKVVYDYDFSIINQVRLAGNKYWFKTVEAKVGDRVEFQIAYQNLGSDAQKNVLIRDILPPSLRYIENSTKLSYVSAESGEQVIVSINDGEPSDILKGINIGNYPQGAQAKILFVAEVVDDNLESGKNTLVNCAQSAVNSKNDIVEDFANVLIYQ